MSKMTFEDKMNRVEEISALLDSGEISIDASIELFSEGAKLIKELNAILNDAQANVDSIASEEVKDEK